ncbi:hypothetical protein J5X84_29965 [Streptosporangiaceae bacterium NEAU-GS5]|nr:hypothetical protein [Streptosporangiaceae bacterium NEAU-GS5]
MRGIGAAVWCVLAAAALTACDADSARYAQTGAQAVRLKAILADMAGLPAGFSGRLRDGWRAPFKPKAGACARVFDLISGRPPRKGLDAAAAGAYQGAQVGETAGVTLSVYAGDGAAEQLERTRDELDACVAADGRAPGAGNHLTSGPLPVHPIGDGVESRRLRGRAGGYPYEMQVVVARADQTLVAIVHAGMRPPDARRTEELARAVAAKVGTLDP